MKKKLVEKFISVEKEIADEKGSFVLFGVFNREDAPYDRWDVVISSPWIDKNRSKTLNYIIDKMSSKLTSDELITLSRVVLLDPAEEFVRDVITETDGVEHQNERLVNCVFRGIPMKNAHIITSKDAT